MDLPTTRLFHLHYNVPEVRHAERALANRDLPLQQRFGRVRSEAVALDPDESEPEDFRLRLQTHQCGYVNLTLAPGRELRFDHLGLCTAAFDDVLERAEEKEWSVRDPDGRRPFVMTPWEFRVELHRNGSNVESSLGDWDQAHLSSVELRVPNPDAVRSGLSDVFGDVPGLSVRPGGDQSRAFVPRFELAGEAFESVEIDATALNSE